MYHEFARLYDKLIMEDISYEKLADFVELQFSSLQIKPELILDLACGTGALTDVLHRRGYDMIGIDLSTDMLNIAKEKNSDILYLCQDMRSFELYGTVDVILCMTDSLNYLLSEQDMMQVFSLAKNYLNPGGLFLFDLNTPYKLRTILGNHTFTYDDNDVFYVWENEWCEQSQSCDFYLTFFVKDGQLYQRLDEQQTQRAYTEQAISKLLQRAGFSHIDCLDGYQAGSNPTNKSERYVFVVR